MRTIATIQGCPIYEGADGRCWMTADADIDCDGVDDAGSPNNIYKDPYYQPDTSLHNNGQALNALTERYIVRPPAAIKGVSDIVIGCQARVHYLKTGLIKEGVVGDQGPQAKVGELSVAMADAIGMPSNPNTGGEENFGMVVYEWWPGKAAVVDGKSYKLQPS